MKKLLFALLLYPFVVLLWLFTELLFGAIFMFDKFMLWRNPRDPEWMTTEIFIEQKKSVDASCKEMFNVLNTVLKGSIAK
jgi:hypothetical protein